MRRIELFYDSTIRSGIFSIWHPFDVHLWVSISLPLNVPHALIASSTLQNNTTELKRFHVTKRSTTHCPCVSNCSVRRIFSHFSLHFNHQRTVRSVLRTLHVEQMWKSIRITKLPVSKLEKPGECIQTFGLRFIPYFVACFVSLALQHQKSEVAQDW